MTPLRRICSGISYGAFWAAFAALISSAVVALSQLRTALRDNEIPPMNWYDTGEMHGPWRHYRHNFSFSVVELLVLAIFLAFISLVFRPTWKAVFLGGLTIALLFPVFQFCVWLID